MDYHDSGGLAVVSVGFPEILLVLVVLAAVLFGAWKLAKIVWAAFPG